MSFLIKGNKANFGSFANVKKGIFSKKKAGKLMHQYRGEKRLDSQKKHQQYSIGTTSTV